MLLSIFVVIIIPESDGRREFAETGSLIVVSLLEKELEGMIVLWRANDSIHFISFVCSYLVVEVAPTSAIRKD